MVFRVLSSLLLFFHAAIGLLLIFGLGMGVGMGELNRESASAQANQYIAYGVLFGLAGFSVLFPYRYGYYLSFVLFLFTLLYLLWLMLNVQGEFLLQLVLFLLELASLCFVAWTYKVNFLVKS